MVKKCEKKLRESWLVVNSVKANRKYHDQLTTNQRFNNLFKQRIGVQKDKGVKKKLKTRTVLSECESKQSKRSRSLISRERNATRNLIKANKNSKVDQNVQPKEPKL